jgi:hypothetical protein
MLGNFHGSGADGPVGVIGRTYNRRRASNAEYFAEPASGEVDDAAAASGQVPSLFAGQPAARRCEQEELEALSIDDALLLDVAAASDCCDALVRCLEARHARRRPYLWVGSVLLAVNPRSELGYYTPEAIERFAASADRGPRTPHIYAVAHAAHNAMHFGRRDQAICCLGAAGAGRTEACRHAIAYLTQTSHRIAMATAGRQPGERRRGMEHTLLMAMEVVEAFGSAAVPGNRHSSRYGQSTELQFSEHGHIVAAHVTTLCLDRSRAAAHAGFGGNFRVFYQLCGGADDRQRRALGGDVTLGKADSYTYLRGGGGGDQAAAMADQHTVAEFAQLQAAMDAIRIDIDQQHQCFRMLVAILLLGNLQVEDNVDGHPRIVDNEDARAVAYLLSVRDQTNLFDAMCHKQVQGRTLGRVSLERDEIFETRDALAVALYEGLFNYVVRCANGALHSSSGSLQSSRQPMNSIHIMDLFGMVSQPTNSFWELMSHYAAEKSHCAFVKCSLGDDASAIQKEGLHFNGRHFEENGEIVRLCEGSDRTGLLPTLKEVCSRSDGSDEVFVEQLLRRSGHNSALGEGKAAGTFTITHYNNETVVYDSAGFLDRNRCRLPKEVHLAVQSSRSGFVQDLLSISTGTRAVADADSRALGAGRRGSAVASVSTRMMASSLQEGLQRLFGAENERWDCQNMHFVRCIAPSGPTSALHFDCEVVKQQIRGANIPEYILQRQQNFAVRVSFGNFLVRWRDLLPADTRHSLTQLDTKQQKNACEDILGALRTVGRSKRGWELGHSLIFLTPSAIRELDGLSGGSCLQPYIRGKLARRQVEVLRGRVLLIQRWYRYALEMRRLVEQRFGKLSRAGSEDVGECYQCFAQHHLRRGVDSIVYLQMQQHTNQLLAMAKAQLVAATQDGVFEPILLALERCKGARAALSAEYTAAELKIDELKTAASKRLTLMVSSSDPRQLLPAVVEFLPLRPFLGSDYDALREQVRHVAGIDKCKCQRWLEERASVSPVHPFDDLLSCKQHRELCELYMVHGYGFTRETDAVLSAESQAQERTHTEIKALLSGTDNDAIDRALALVAVCGDLIDVGLQDALRERRGFLHEVSVYKALLDSIQALPSGRVMQSALQVFDAAGDSVRQLLQAQYSTVLRLVALRSLRDSENPAEIRVGLHQHDGTELSEAEIVEVSAVKTHLQGLISSMQEQIVVARSSDDLNNAKVVLQTAQLYLDEESVAHAVEDLEQHCQQLLVTAQQTLALASSGTSVTVMDVALEKFGGTQGVQAELEQLRGRRQQLLQSISMELEDLLRLDSTDAVAVTELLLKNAVYQDDIDAWHRAQQHRSQLVSQFQERVIVVTRAPEASMRDLIGIVQEAVDPAVCELGRVLVGKLEVEQQQSADALSGNLDQQQQAIAELTHQLDESRMESAKLDRNLEESQRALQQLEAEWSLRLQQSKGESEAALRAREEEWARQLRDCQEEAAELELAWEESRDAYDHLVASNGLRPSPRSTQRESEEARRVWLMDRLLHRARLRAVASCLRCWRTSVQSAEIRRRVTSGNVPRLTALRLELSFRQFREGVHTQLLFRQQTLHHRAELDLMRAKQCNRALRHRNGRIFTVWRHCTQDDRRVRKQLISLRGHVRLAMRRLHAVWRTWCAGVELCQSERDHAELLRVNEDVARHYQESAVEAVLKLHARMVVYACFAAWSCEMVSARSVMQTEAEHLADVQRAGVENAKIRMRFQLLGAQRAGQRRATTCLSDAFCAWTRFIGRIKVYSALLSRMSKRMHQSALVSAFQRWRSAQSHHRASARRVTMLVTKFCGDGLARVFRSWDLLTRREVRTRLRLAQEEAQTWQSSAVEERLKMASDLTVARDRLLQVGHRLADGAFSRWAAGHTFRHWKQCHDELTGKRRRVVAFLRRSAFAITLRSLRTWMEAVRSEQTQSRLQCLLLEEDEMKLRVTRMQEQVARQQEEVRRSAAMEAAMGQLLQCARQAFQCWLQLVLQKHELRRRLWHCLRVLGTRALTECFRQWTAWLELRELSKIEMDAKLRKMAMHGSGAGFARWWHRRCESSFRRIGNDLGCLLSDCHAYKQRVDLGSSWSTQAGVEHMLVGEWRLRSMPEELDMLGDEQLDAPLPPPLPSPLGSSRRSNSVYASTQMRDTTTPKGYAERVSAVQDGSRGVPTGVHGLRSGVGSGRSRRVGSSSMASPAATRHAATTPPRARTGTAAGAFSELTYGPGHRRVPAADASGESHVWRAAEQLTALPTAETDVWPSLCELHLHLE